MLRTLHLFSLELRTYDVCNVIAIVGMFVFNLLQLRKKAALWSHPHNLFSARFLPRLRTKAKREKADRLYLHLEIMLLTAFQFLPGVFLNPVFGRAFSGGDVNYFGTALVSPLIFLFLCYALKIAPFEHLDLFTPAYALALFFFKTACLTHGCCEGIVCSFGYVLEGETVRRFPIQALEMLFALLIFLFLLRYRKKAKPCTMRPMFLILYSATRFFAEFLRVDEIMVGALDVYQLLSLAGLVIGIAEYALAVKYGGKLYHTRGGRTGRVRGK